VLSDVTGFQKFQASGIFGLPKVLTRQCERVSGARAARPIFPSGVDRERKNGMVGAEPPGNGSRACEAVRAVQGGDSLRHTPLNFLGKRAFRQCYPLLNPQALIQSASFDGTVRSGVTSIGGATVCSIMVP
jgi:hypothetical protein